MTAAPTWWRCRRRRRALLWVLSALSALVLLAGCGGDEATPAAAPSDDGPRTSFGERTLALDLYYPGAGGVLHPRPRELAVPDDPAAQIRVVVEALLAGPREGEEVQRVFPEAAGVVEVAEVYLSPDGVAVLDLKPAEGDWEPVAGSRQELMMVYSLVNTVSLNVPAARRVALLWDGVQRPTFAGHVDTTRPLAPAPDLVAR